MIIGNSHVVSFLNRCMQAGEFSRTYLFVGPESVGKTHVAMEYARTVQEVHPSTDSVSSLQAGSGQVSQSFAAFAARKEDCSCDSCRAIVQGTHPDVMVFLNPLAIENVRVLKKQLAQSPLVSPYHIVIIKNIQKATPEAAQALLKILEEPSASTIFFLTAEHISSVLPTIVSRSIPLHFSLVSLKEMQILFQGNKKPLELLPHWQGRPGRLIRLFSDSAYAQNVAEEKKRAEKFLHSSIAQRFSIAQQIGALEKQDALTLLEEWMLWWQPSCLPGLPAGRQDKQTHALQSLYQIYQALLRSPINIQTSLEYLALCTQYIDLKERIPYETA